MTEPRSSAAARRKRTVEDISEEFLDCRDLGHSWRHSEAWEEKRWRTWHRTVVCVNCGTQRHQVLDHYGHRMSASYSYAPGYLVKGAQFTIDDRARLRLRNIRRTIAENARRPPPQE